jgi:outer membrane protein, heavy metal efflux system
MTLVLLLFPLSFSFALTKAQLTESVINNFPLIEEALLKRMSAQSEVESARGAFDHKLSFESRNRIEDKYDNQYFQTVLSRNTGLWGAELMVGHRQGIGHFPAYDGKFETSGAGEIFAGLTLPLLRDRSTDGFRTELALKSIDEKISQAEIDLKKNMYLHKALSLYYKLVLELQKLKIYQTVLDLAESRHRMIEAKFKAGDIERLKIDENQRAIDKRRAEIIKTSVGIDKLKNELSLYIRDKNGTSVSFDISQPSAILLDKFYNLSHKAPKNPQLAILELERKRLKQELELADQSRLPGLSLQLLGAKELSANNPYDPQSMQVGLKFDFPLENRKAEGKSVSLNFKLQALSKRLLYIEEELSRFMTFSLRASEQAKDLFEVSTKEYERTLKLATAEKSRFFQGSSDLFVVNLREQDLADVEIRRWASLYDYHQYMLDYRLFSGSFYP